MVDLNVFWDYENLPLPKGLPPDLACDRILRFIATRFGKVKACKLYHNFSARDSFWSTLDSTVFDLVHTPHRNSKETVDKKLLADMIFSAWDAGSKPTGVVVLTSDGDYAYALNQLRTRNIQTIVVTGPQPASVLCSSADVVLSLADILGASEKSSMSDRSIVRAVSAEDPVGEDMDRLIKIMKEIDEEWVSVSLVGKRFYNAIGERSASRFQSAKDRMVKSDTLHLGRKLLVGNQRVVELGEIHNTEAFGSREYWQLAEYASDDTSTTAQTTSLSEGETLGEQEATLENVRLLCRELSGENGKPKWTSAKRVAGRFYSVTNNEADYRATRDFALQENYILSGDREDNGAIRSVKSLGTFLRLTNKGVRFIEEESSSDDSGPKSCAPPNIVQVDDTVSLDGKVFLGIIRESSEEGWCPGKRIAGDFFAQIGSRDIDRYRKVRDEAQDSGWVFHRCTESCDFLKLTQRGISHLEAMKKRKRHFSARQDKQDMKRYKK